MARLSGGGDSSDGTTSSGSTSSTSTDPGGSSLSNTLEAFARDPKGFILAIVAAWLVGGVLFVGQVVVDGILQVWGILLIVPTTVRDAVVAAGAAIGGPILTFAVDLHVAIVGLAGSLGPFGPIVIPVIYLILAIGFVRIGAFIVDVVDVPFVDLGALLRGISIVPRAIWRLFSRG